MSALDQFRTDLAVIIDLAVEDQGGIRVVANEWLVAINEVEDLQPNGAKSRLASFEDAMLIRPPMIQNLSNASSYT